jgi:hypothetical protein
MDNDNQQISGISVVAGKLQLFRHSIYAMQIPVIITLILSAQNALHTTGLATEHQQI